MTYLLCLMNSFLVNKRNCMNSFFISIGEYFSVNKNDIPSVQQKTIDIFCQRSREWDREKYEKELKIMKIYSK